MSRAENRAYWGATDTTPQALDNLAVHCEGTLTETSSEMQLSKQNFQSRGGNVSTTSSIDALGNNQYK